MRYHHVYTTSPNRATPSTASTRLWYRRMLYEYAPQVSAANHMVAFLDLPIENFHSLGEIFWYRDAAILHLSLLFLGLDRPEYRFVERLQATQ